VTPATALGSAAVGGGCWEGGCWPWTEKLMGPTNWSVLVSNTHEPGQPPRRSSGGHEQEPCCSPPASNPGAELFGVPPAAPSPAAGPSPCPHPRPLPSRRSQRISGRVGKMPISRLALCRAACGPRPSPTPCHPPSLSPSRLCPRRASPPSSFQLQVPFGCGCKSHILYAVFSSVRYLMIGFELLILIETHAGVGM